MVCSPGDGSGIESSNFFIQLLKPTSFSPILAIIGIAFIMFSKKEKKHDIGLILVGFAVLMTGMDIMSGAVKPLADVPEFTNILTMFSHHILGLLAGAVLTAIIQSSSASVGILQALCVTGSVSYGAAIPIIMGQNIGTCVTAMLSGIGATKNAKRAALVHLYFNIIGTTLFMVVFYSINAFVDFTFLKDAANGAGIAVIHSLFNVAATLVLLPFSKGLEKLACLTVKDSPEDAQISETAKELQLLDARFIETPGLAMEHCRKVSVTMAHLAKKAILDAMDLIQSYDEKKAQEVIRLEGEVDRFEDQLGSYMVKVSSRDLSEKDSHSLNVLLHCIGDFERISDHAVNLVAAAKEMYEKEVCFSNKATEELQVYTNAIRDILDTTMSVFETGDKALASLVEPMEEVVDELNIEVKRRHVKRLRKGKCTIELGFILSD
ncbi:MAG: Na/Pi cotransporter family protein, partial [Lachnospiraceae bacterium]|nr:Na/Pi cotransporter family protein [Lachnospiraceae bacterium]